MANTDKKRRAERDLKELWQYLDAKYFIKLNKKQLIVRINSILREIGTTNIADFPLGQTALVSATNAATSFSQARPKKFVIKPPSDSQLNFLGFQEPSSTEQKVQLKNRRQLTLKQKRNQKSATFGLISEQEDNEESMEDDSDGDAYGDEVDRYNESYSTQQQHQNRNTEESNVKGRGVNSSDSVFRRILPKILLEDREIQEILEEEEMQPKWKRQRTQLTTLDESIFNLDHIEQKGGYKQFYSDLFDKIDVDTNWKYNIQKNSVNFDYNDRFEQGMIQSKIRNMFDIEFNKKFQGSLQFPLLQMGTLRSQQLKQQLANSQQNALAKNQPNRYRSSNYASFDNRYLFFISDKLDNEKDLEKKERDKFLPTDDDKEDSPDDDSNENSLSQSASASDSKPKNELRTLGFIDEEDSKESSLSVKDKRAANGNEEGRDVIEALLNNKGHKYKSATNPQNDNADLLKPQSKLQSMDQSLLGFIGSNHPMINGDAKNGEINPEEQPSKRMKKSQIEAQECNLNSELQNLMQIHEEMKKDIAQSMGTLKCNVLTHSEPDCMRILQSKINKEREYLQNQIIKMEIKQIAESITRVTHAKKIVKPNPQVNKASLRKNQGDSDDSEQAYTFGQSHEEIGLKNRPKLLRNFLKQQEKRNSSKQRSSKQQAANSLLKNKQVYEHLFRIEFDPSMGIPDAWVETKTLNYFNTLRENIYASSSQFDLIYLQNLQEVKEKNMKPNKQQNSKPTQLTQSQKTNQSNQKLMQPIDVQESVALQRGKRSCTLADVKKNMQQKLNNNSKTDSGTSGIMSVESLIDQAKILTEGNKPVGSIVKNQLVNNDAYDFCHYCKQLKNKFLLISCKYSSKNTPPLYNKNHPASGQTMNYVPYPYEPQCYQVKDIKIHNADFQNKAQIRGLMESTKKNLKIRNLALITAQQALKQQIEVEGNNSIFAKMQNGIDISTFQMNKSMVSRVNNGNGSKFKSDMMPLPSHQLLSWLQDLDINPYTLDPYDQTQYSTELKTIYPNFYKQLYQGFNCFTCPGQPKASQKKTVVEYECKRKYCTFCLQTNFDESLNDIIRNKNWHCHHCTGYCFCTRCQRQEITTQLKGYLISLGGNLNVLKNNGDSASDPQDQCLSLFDQFILKQFNEHLEVTLAYNQGLYEKYPYYANMIRSLPYEEPDQDLMEEDQIDQIDLIAEAMKEMAKSKEQNKFFVQKTAVGMNKDPLKLGFTLSDEEQNRDIRKSFNNNISESSLKNNNGAVNKFNNQKAQYAAYLQQKSPEINLQKEYEKLALSMLFKYSMYNKKIDDQFGGAGSSFNTFASKPEESLSDKKFQEQLIRSIRTHDSEIKNRIQKRRGRKKFILGQEDSSVADTFQGLKALFNRREQKYLEKVVQMRDNPLQSSDIMKIQPLVNGDMQEFKENWPKSNQRCLQGLQKLLTSYKLPLLNDGESQEEGSLNTTLLKEQMNSLKDKHRKGRKINVKVR